jgi:hypothetical protein
LTAAASVAGGAPITVPYITQWSGEQTSRVSVVQRRRGIAYSDERPGDRDEHGVLWIRESSQPGQGRPLFGKIHSRRQRKAMTKLLCQVCGQRADRNDDGVLWLICEDSQRPETWPDELSVGDPPVCARCAAMAVRLCPRLRRQYTALRVSSHDVVGVWGAIYLPGHTRPVTVNGVAFDDPLIRWVKAANLIAHLRNFTVVELDVLMRDQHAGLTEKL